MYGGCKGNQNNFLSEIDCVRRCGDEQARAALPDEQILDTREIGQLTFFFLRSLPQTCRNLSRAKKLGLPTSQLLHRFTITCRVGRPQAQTSTKFLPADCSLIAVKNMILQTHKTNWLTMEKACRQNYPRFVLVYDGVTRWRTRLCLSAYNKYSCTRLSTVRLGNFARSCLFLKIRF